ncbi:MAG: S8 family serine peptidase, partial [candidate division WOR-3 bacterium]
IDKIWIKEIIERQNKDGGWSIHGRAGEASKSHGAVVSLLALLPYKQYYLDKKPNNFGWLKELPIKEHLSQNQKISESLKKELRKNSQARVMIKYKNTADFIKISGKIKKPLKNIKAKHLLTNLSSFEIESLKNDPAIELMALDYPIKADLIESLDLIEYNDFKGKYSYSGKGVKLCLVDSGIDHNEFSYIAGYDFVNEDAIPEDESGHGTLVAKIIKSIAPDADLIVAKVLDKNNVGFSSNLLRAFDFCKAQGAKIINLSLGGGSFDGFCDAEPVSQALNQLALENNIFSVASAGNDGLDNNLAMPACASQVFSVGAVDKKDKIASFSNRSVLLDMFAPGENLNIQGKSYSGTSFSAPFVSSAGALLLEKEPLISLSDLKNRLKSSGDPISYYFHNDKIIPISQVFAPYNNQVIQIARLNILNFIENKQTLAPFDYSWYWQAADQEIVGVTGMPPVSTQQINTDQFSTGGCAPGGISNLAQFKNNCSSSFSGTCPGASCWTNQTTVCFKGDLTMGDNTSVKMDVEYILSSSSFTNTPNASSSNCSANCTATATSGTLTSGSTYKWQALNNGNVCSSNWLTFNSGNAAFTVDTGAPSCSISSISESSSQMYVSGTTLYYNNNSGTGTFTVNSSASDSISGVQKVNFPNTVSNGGDDTTSPYSWIYSWDTADTFSSSATVTCYDNATNSATANFTVTRDITAPTSLFISYTNGYITTTTNQITFSASDGGAGVASYTLFYRSATLSNNSCGSFGSWTSLGNQTSPFNHTVSSGNCYQYYMTATDNVNNSASTSQSPTATTKVDTTAPTDGSVNDGSGADIDEQVSDTTYQMNWSGFSDNQSGLRSANTYEYAFRRSTDNYYWNGSAWQAGSYTFFTTSTSVTITGLNLYPNIKYFSQVRAYNNADLVSSYINSDGVYVAPALTFSLSATSVNLGTLSTGTVATGSITATTSTNAPNGYVTKIYTDGNFRTLSGMNFSY